MDEIEQRLRDVSDSCVKAYLAWAGNKKDAELREELQDTIHELRKVSARLEIEIAVSERGEMVSRPISTPPHRSTRKRGDEDGDNGNGNGNGNGNSPGNSSGNESGNNDRQNAVRQGMRRRPPTQGRGNAE